jgi:hypothetical protein
MGIGEALKLCNEWHGKSPIKTIIEEMAQLELAIVCAPGWVTRASTVLFRWLFRSRSTSRLIESKLSFETHEIHLNMYCALRSFLYIQHTVIL